MRILILPLLLVTLAANAQSIAITTDGRRVLLNDDGTWKAIDKAGEAAEVDTTCASLLVEGTDQAGKPSRTSPLIVVTYDGGTSGIAIVLDGSTKGHYTLNLNCAGAKGCIGKYAKVRFTFRDGSELTVASDAQANCKGIVPIHMGGSDGRKELLTALAQARLRTIRIWLGDDMLERELSEANSETLMHSARCLLR